MLVVGQLDYDQGSTMVTVWDPTREPFAHAQRLDVTGGPLLAVSAAVGPKGSLMVGAVPTAGHINAVAVAEMGKHLMAVVADRDESWTGGRLRLLDLDEGEMGRTLLTEPAGSAQSVAVAGGRDGRPLAVSGHRDGAIRLWDLDAATEAGAPRYAHAGELRSVTTATVAGRPVAVTGGDHSVRVWDLSRPDSHRLNGEHAIPVSVMALAELGGRQVAVTGGRDGVVRVWDLATGHLATTIDPGTGSEAIALADDGTLLIGGRLGLLALQLHPALFG